MKCNARCWTPPRVVLVIATLSLSGCAEGGSDLGAHVLCPPVVEYSREVQARAADELDLLPEGSVVAEMLSDYALLRMQIRACQAGA